MFQQVTFFSIFDTCESFWTPWKIVGTFKKIRPFSKVSGHSKKPPETLESFQTLRKVFRHSGRHPDTLESFQTLWKTFRTLWKDFGHFGKFLSTPESFQISGSFYVLLKVCWHSWKLPDTLGSVQMSCLESVCASKSAIWKVFAYSVSALFLPLTAF